MRVKERRKEFRAQLGLALFWDRTVLFLPPHVKVSRAFTAKFGYETRDVTVLLRSWHLGVYRRAVPGLPQRFRFWQSMPNNIRAGLQVRISD